MVWSMKPSSMRVERISELKRLLAEIFSNNLIALILFHDVYSLEVSNKHSLIRCRTLSFFSKN